MDPVLAAFDRERWSLVHPGFTRVEEFGTVRHHAAGGRQGFVSWSRHAPAEVARTIGRVIDAFAGAPFEWKVFAHDEPADLRDRLARRGFAIGAAEEFLVLDVAAATPAVDHRPRVERVTDPARLDDYFAVATAVWGDGLSRTRTEQTFRDDPSGHVAYVAYDGPRPVASARAIFTPGSCFAYLATGATLPAFRNRGFYTALVAARAEDARARGYAHAMVDAFPTSRPILERTGFRRLSTTWPCQWAGAEHAPPKKRIPAHAPKRRRGR